MHLPDVKFRTAGRIRLLSDGDGEYYVGMYRVNPGDPGNTVDYRRVPFELGVKQGLREEPFYDSENGNQSTMRAFLIRFRPDGQKEYVFTGQLPLALDLATIRGEITWLGVYVGQYVTGCEVVEGEGKVFR